MKVYEKYIGFLKKKIEVSCLFFFLYSERIIDKRFYFC